VQAYLITHGGNKKLSFLNRGLQQERFDLRNGRCGVMEHALLENEKVAPGPVTVLNPRHRKG